MGFVLEVETNYLCLSSSTKMPRMKYVHRRRLKRILFGWCLFMAICVIFWLLNILNAPVARLENKLYVYWMSSDEELKADMEWDLSNLPNVVLTRVKTFDHDAALQTAYDDGHPVVLVVRDGVELSKTLLKEWEKLIVTAPADWSILQLWTDNLDIRRHSEALQDPWIRWFPEHTSEAAYFINRQGMRLALQKKGRLFERAQTYTCTRTYAKALQLAELSNAIPKWPRRNTSTLIITTTMIRNRNEFESFLKDWSSDAKAVVAKWHLTIVVNDMYMYNHVIESWPKWPFVELHVEVMQGRYNKFYFVRRSIPQMKYYKHVLIKDSDIRLAGFPWYTFISMSKDAVVTGALRQIKHGLDTRQWFHIQDGYAWKQKMTYKYKTLMGLSMTFLEQFFVLVDGPFAHSFFHRTLTDAFLLDDDGTMVASDWGLDLLWCGAAQQWSTTRTPCLLVPVVSQHDDTRQIPLWNTSAHTKYVNMRQLDKYKRTFPEWLFHDRTDVAHEFEPVK